ncbi:MAG: RNA methyltransferase [Gammaproteobacteria bacterium]|nr:RNA methyltransferase [Gammaproteobacteria bacterium]
MRDDTDLSAVRIVLSHTSHPGNIGAAARAMKTMGLSRLYLVNPKHFPHPDALALATGAADMLDKAVVCESLDVALAGTVMAIAATARHRNLSHEVVSCRQACQRLVGETPRGEVALVFGTERAGLTIAEIGKCGLIATIPTNEAYASLNLAQAVQVFAYELRMALDIPRDVQPDASVKMAAHDDVERFYEHLEQVLYETEFLDPAQPNRLMQRLRRLFARARLEKEEVNILRGILSAMQDKGQ